MMLNTRKEYAIFQTITKNTYKITYDFVDISMKSLESLELSIKMNNKLGKRNQKCLIC